VLVKSTECAAVPFPKVKLAVGATIATVCVTLLVDVAFVTVSFTSKLVPALKVCVTVAPDPAGEPSPKSQATVVNGDPVDVFVKVIVRAGLAAGAKVKAATGGATATVIGVALSSVAPVAATTDRVTTNGPAAEYVCDVVAPDAVAELSPKSQTSEVKGPPVVVLVKVMACPATRGELMVNAATITGTTCTPAVVDAVPPELTSVRRTVKLPAAAYTCVGLSADDGADESPKSQVVAENGPPCEVLVNDTALPATAGVDAVNEATGGGTVTAIVAVLELDPVMFAIVSRTV